MLVVFSGMLDIIKMSAKDLSAADQELMQQFEYHVNSSRTNFIITVSPPNYVGSLINWRLISTVLDHLGILDPSQVNVMDSALGSILHGNVIGADCHAL